MSSSGRRVVVTQRNFDAEAIAYLRARGCEAVIADEAPADGEGALSEDALVARLDGAAGWIVGHAHVTRSLLGRLPALQVVSRRGVGYERVDLAAVRDAGKVACIAAGANEASVADHTLALILAVGHRLRETQARMQAGDWTILPGNDLYRRTVGIIGSGRIGRAVAQRLAGFEATVLVHTRNPDAGWGKALGVEFVDLSTLLERSDYVTLHAPLTPQTQNLIDADALARMKPTAYLINTGRGGLVDDLALLEALQNGRLAGAALDVFLSESDPALKPVTEALVALPNLIATPHAAASTREGLERTNMVAASNVVAVLDGGAPPAACLVADGRPASAA